jgi:hypothetical protein
MGMLPANEVLRCGGEVLMSQFAIARVGMGREKYVAEPQTGTPPRKICAQFHSYKHTSLVPSINESREVRLTLTDNKVRNVCRNAWETVVM